MRVHTGKALVVGVAALALGLAACSSSGKGGGGGGNTPAANPGTGNFADCATKGNTCNSGTTKAGGTVTYTIEKKISGWNLNTAASNTFDYAEALDGVLPNAFNVNPDFSIVLNDDLMVSADQTSTDPQTLVYKIKPEAVWDDGTPINADDFEWAYVSENATTCPDCGAASTAGYDQIKSLTASDGGKTVTVVMDKPYADWKSMFSGMYPGHVAKAHGDDGTAAGYAKAMKWFDTNRPTYSGGPYAISDYQKDVSITEKPNPKWYGKVKPSLASLIFRINTDQTTEVTSLQNNEVDVIYPQPSPDLVTQAKAVTGVSTLLGKGLLWEHLDLNTKNKFLSDPSLRLAIFTAVNRKDIIDRTVGQFVPGASALGNHIFMPSQDGYKDNVTSTGQGSGDLKKAEQILKDAGYTGVGTALKTKDGADVTFRFTFSEGNTLREQTAKIVQTQLKKLGINVTLKSTPDLSVLDKHDFDMIVFAWVGTPFLVTGTYQTFSPHSDSNFTQVVDPKLDSILSKVLVELDPTMQKQLLNDADVQFQSDAVELPLFQKPTFLAARDTIVNLRDNASSVGPPYNVQEWGLKA